MKATKNDIIEQVKTILRLANDNDMLDGLCSEGTQELNRLKDMCKIPVSNVIDSEYFGFRLEDFDILDLENVYEFCEEAEVVVKFRGKEYNGVDFDC